MTGGLIGSLAVSPEYAVSENPELFCDLPGQELAISPVADLQDGEQVTWQSAVKGTAPTTFTGEYVGKLDNGLGADADGNPRDLLLVKLDGDVVNGSAGSLAAGVWAGASGSPVYDADGALIGAVSYGFSFLPDNVAGVTPAAYMKTIGKLPASKTLSGTAKQQVARMADETATGRTSTLRRIELVRVTVGATAAELDGVNADLAQRVKGFRGAAARIPRGARRQRALRRHDALDHLPPRPRRAGLALGVGESADGHPARRQDGDVPSRGARAEALTPRGHPSRFSPVQGLRRDGFLPSREARLRA